MTKQQMVFLFLKLSKPMFRLTIARNKEHDKMKRNERMGIAAAMLLGTICLSVSPVYAESAVYTTTEKNVTKKL